MRVRVEKGKGAKARYTVLSPILLDLFRRYRKIQRPKDYLFPRLHPGTHVQPATIQEIRREACRIAGIENGTATRTIQTIQVLLGHSHIDTIVGPLDRTQPKPPRVRKANAQNLPGVTESRRVLAAAGADYVLPKPQADEDFSALDAFLVGNNFGNNLGNNQNPFVKPPNQRPHQSGIAPPKSQTKAP